MRDCQRDCCTRRPARAQDGVADPKKLKKWGVSDRFLWKTEQPDAWWVRPHLFLRKNVLLIPWSLVARDRFCYENRISWVISDIFWWRTEEPVICLCMFMELYIKGHSGRASQLNTKGDVVETETKAPASQLKSVPCSHLNNLHEDKGLSFSILPRF